MPASVVFVVNVYRDVRLAARLQEQLHEVYPEANMLVVGDIPRLKDKLTGEWTDRYLKHALALSEADVIIKLDPDSCVWRRFELPEADWFGTLSNSGTFIRGGGCGFSRRAALALVASKILLNPSPHSYLRYKEFRWPHEEESDTLLSCQDQIVGDAMKLLDIRPTPWPEVLILGNELRVPERENYAITHPHPCLA